MTELCLCLLLRRSPGFEILLGEKLRGLGKGNLIGPGGHIEAGESRREATVREVAEETGLTINPEDLEPAAELVFEFTSSPHLNCRVWVFRAERWQGQLRASDELDASWHDALTPPLDAMWDDNKYWLTRAIAGEHIRGKFTLGPDDATVARAELG